MMFEDIIDSPAVRYHITFESPLFSKDCAEQFRRPTASITHKPVIGTHHRKRAAFSDACLERRQIRIVQIMIIYDCIERMSIRLGAAVDGIMFRCGDDLKIFWIISLQPFHKRNTHSRRQVRIFAVRFLAASPAGVAEDVDVWTPKCQPFIDISFSFPQKFIVLCPWLQSISHQPHSASYPCPSSPKGRWPEETPSLSLPLQHRAGIHSTNRIQEFANAESLLRR